MANGIVSQRGYDLKRVAHLYRHVEPYGPDVCVYCGDPANTTDHVTPVSYVAGLLDVIDHYSHKLRHGLYTVPCCRDCNVRLGRFVGFSITEKRAELKRRLRIKHRRLLGRYDWQPEEIAELGYSLRTYMRRQENERSGVIARLEFPRPWEATLLRSACRV